jgi:hypothetical protein
VGFTQEIRSLEKEIPFSPFNRQQTKERSDIRRDESYASEISEQQSLATSRTLYEMRDQDAPPTPVSVKQKSN